jgi:hypothetical protein
MVTILDILWFIVYKVWLNFVMIYWKKIFKVEHEGWDELEIKDWGYFLFLFKEFF